MREIKNINLVKQFISGSSVIFVFNISANLTGFVVSVIVARAYGPGIIGLVATISSLVTLCTTLAICGTDTLSLKIVSRDLSRKAIERLRNQFVEIILVIVLVLSILMFFANNWGLETTSIALFDYSFLVIALLILSSLHRSHVYILRALGDVYFYASMSLFQISCQLVFVLVAVWLTVPANALPYFYFAAYIVVCIWSFSIYRSKKSKLSDKNTDLVLTKREILNSSMPMIGSTIGFTIISSADIIMLGYFVEASEVGVYAVYNRLIMVAYILSNGVNAMIAPTIAGMFRDQRNRELKNYVKVTTVVTLAGTFIVVLMLFFLHDFILNVYGENFVGVPIAFYLMLLIPVLNTFFGPTGHFMNMTGKERLFMKVMWIAAMINVGLNFVLIPLLGIAGAALASFVTVLFWNALVTQSIYSDEGYTLLPLNIRKSDL